MKLSILKLIFFVVIFSGITKVYSQSHIERSSISLELIMPNDFLREYKIEIANNTYFDLNSDLTLTISKKQGLPFILKKKLPLKIYRSIEEEIYKINPKDIFSTPLIADDGGKHIFKITNRNGEIQYVFSDLNNSDIPINSTYLSLKNVCKILLNSAEIEDVSFNN